MNKIALITDSTCDLNQDTLQKYNVHLLPFRIVYKDREYLDGVDITPQEVYDRLKTEIPTTAMPTLKDIHNVYRKLETEGYTHAIFITLSSGLSGILNSIQLVKDNYPAIQTCIFDSKSISLGEGVLVETCGQMIQEGKRFDEIIEKLHELRKKMQVFFIVDTLEYLVKGGRIGRVMGTIGDILNIKPIISIGENDGKYYTYDKVRGRKRSISRMLDIGREILAEKKCKIYVMSGGAREEAKQVMEKLAELKNVISITFGGDLSPVSGVHSGPGLVGVLFVEA